MTDLPISLRVINSAISPQVTDRCSFKCSLTVKEPLSVKFPLPSFLNVPQLVRNPYFLLYCKDTLKVLLSALKIPYQNHHYKFDSYSFPSV